MIHSHLLDFAVKHLFFFKDDPVFIYIKIPIVLLVVSINLFLFLFFFKFFARVNPHPTQVSFDQRYNQGLINGCFRGRKVLHPLSYKRIFIFFCCMVSYKLIGESIFTSIIHCHARNVKPECQTAILNLSIETFANLLHLHSDIVVQKTQKETRHSFSAYLFI